LVVLMGAARARQLGERLVAGGLDASTPVAIITSATNADQDVARVTLAELGVTPVRNPATIVIGAVAGRDVTAESDRELHQLAGAATGGFEP
jgi:uroporphyrin-III C-methyltransferase/precorrin-2 dehydrogenase/sirohydrochlorin ferrochelatase